MRDKFCYCSEEYLVFSGDFVRPRGVAQVLCNRTDRLVLRQFDF